MKQIVKRMADLAMLVLLPLLMAEILTGQEIHEWPGTLMLVLFFTHHLLNLGWWKGLLKGKYTPSRAFGTALDLLLLLDMTALCVSGIMMSGFVFRFLHVNGGMILARQLHLFASHWGLILMSALYLLTADFNPKIQKVYLCLDNDGPGQTAAKRISDKLFTKGISHEILVPIHKDWNEDLIYPTEEESEEEGETECQALQP